MKPLAFQCPESPREGQTCWRGPHRAKGVCQAKLAVWTDPGAGRGGVTGLDGKEPSPPRGQKAHAAEGDAWTASPQRRAWRRRRGSDRSGVTLCPAVRPRQPPRNMLTAREGQRHSPCRNSTRLSHNHASPELITASQDFPNGALEGLSAS